MIKTLPVSLLTKDNESLLLILSYLISKRFKQLIIKSSKLDNLFAETMYLLFYPLIRF
ncbi:hypothetical protein CM15mP35_01630 [bacterium]|nr:MAG: hypothetical protein CM15mP35_01630 [bacterium]